MSDISGIAANAFSQLSQAKYSSASKQAQQLGGSSDSQKIKRSATEFESILLTSWLESAEKSFATVPGGDGNDENKDPGKNQFQSYAMQAVAATLTKAGGVGIASMIVSRLDKAAAAKQSIEAPAGKTTTSGIGFSAGKGKI